MTALVVGSLACVTWMYLLAARGGFWRATERDGVAATIPSAGFGWPRVVAVVPARDEADVVGGSVVSLLRQDYRGEFVVIVVDDHSTDDTAAVARSAAVAAGASGRMIVLAAPGLPDGWTGKLWALHQGVAHALSLPKPPDYLLLTDADIHHAVDTLTELVLRATRGHTVLTSLMARLRCKSAGERAM